MVTVPLILGNVMTQVNKLNNKGWKVAKTHWKNLPLSYYKINIDDSFILSNYRRTSIERIIQDEFDNFGKFFLLKVKFH